ncbi:DNRLRE domain-containing protein [Arthrobacter sp. W4I7]|uniref:CBM96 family carbohydrate-binding protein n=1 Tax=Arthrobacter sp. W4I7 TaxID=3042296 RepID=UPI002780BBD2|nr:DNRLRE domain-containing protein [Arthrobacter sp. W4I7]MDQ0693388.1 hypothetical protein [Arthrobacter sp. W4I7]
MWFNDGIWWGSLWDTASSDFHVFKFNGTTSSWADTGVVTETRASSHQDVLWDGNTLYVASYRFVNDGLPSEPNFPTTMRRYSYDPVAKKYTLLGSETINNQKVEVLTIDKDSTGRVWATWQQGNRIFMNATATDGKTWGTPFAHPASLSNVSVDDTSAVIAFDGKMGVMWSRQVGDATDGMYWSYHVDGAVNNAWTTPVAAVKGQRSADDHMNLKWLDTTTSGKVFAAVKTSNTSASLPLIQLLALDTAAASWSAHTIATVAECPNRVIVLIDEAAQQIRTFATYPKPGSTTNAGVCTSSGGAIYEKSTPLNNINFTTTKTARIVDADQYVHNVTSTKQNLNSNTSRTANSGLLVLADVNATSRYWHYYDSTGGAGGTTPPPTGTTTPPPTGGTSQTVTVPASADTYVSSGATATNFGASTTLGVDASSVENTYLKFDLSAYAGRTLQSAALRLGSGGNSSTGKQNIKLVADDTWTESGITYNNRPALGTSIGTLGPTAINTSYDVPLTVGGVASELGQQLSLGMDSSSSDGLDLNSKEVIGKAPTLVLTFG